jgi:glyoxylase-like metal-dependent hydrolase (beta-lactamase superfamily II)
MVGRNARGPILEECAGMTVTTIALQVPFAVRAVNCYLLEGDPLMLIDPGADWHETMVELEDALADRGLRVEDVEQVILTHQHYDHVGLAHRVRERSGATVVAHHLLREFLADLPGQMELEDTYQADVMRLHGVPEAAIQELYEVSREHRVYGGSVTVDRLIGDGDVVVAGGRELHVAVRPGHSPTDTVFTTEAERVTFSGDHLIGHISSNPVIHRPLDRPADTRDRMRSLPRYIDSMRRTATLDVDVLLPGHGNPVEDHAALVAERLEFHQRRKERIFGGLGGESKTARTLALDLWGQLAEREAFLTLSEALGHLDLLEEEGRVVVEEEDGLLRYRAL